MAGRLIAVVGPSGAGKDSLLGALLQARADDLHLAQRMITRPTNAGGEDFVGLNVAEFQAKKAAGAFVVDWEAHGLFYGIPWAEFTPLDQGKDVIFNAPAFAKSQSTFLRARNRLNNGPYSRFGPKTGRTWARNGERNHRPLGPRTL